MKKIKPFLLLGLIFALVCSVSFAAPPGKATLTEFKKYVSFSIDQVCTPAITVQISEFAFDDLRQHRAESYVVYTHKEKTNLPAAVADFNDFTYKYPLKLYGYNDKNHILILRPCKVYTYKMCSYYRQLPQKNSIPCLPVLCNKRE